ncbi:hypothetical protein, partial [Paraburkholderia humisilvae]|uniref:hypothetical protein n=1 Tax=Paraburkholderia humisilvae TaxID=627669 RepID=UPI0035EF5959
SKALSTDLRSSPRAGFRQPCGDVMIYGNVNKRPSRRNGRDRKKPYVGGAIIGRMHLALLKTEWVTSRT